MIKLKITHIRSNKQNHSIKLSQMDAITVKTVNYKVMDLIKLIDQIKERNSIKDHGFFDFFGIFKTKTECEKKLEIFLKQIPMSSNYTIEITAMPWGNLREMYYIDMTHRKSLTKISDHLKVKGLTNECEIGLTPGQYEMLKELCR